MASAPVTTTLVTGASAHAREAAIAGALTDASRIPSTAVILEGLASGTSPLDAIQNQLRFARIAPGCLCCTGNLVLRVTLNRLLRQRPERLFIGVARGEHLDQLRSWLQSQPYDQLLRLTDDIRV
jgi:G3E family GTPase